MFTLTGTVLIEGKETPVNAYAYAQPVQVQVSPLGFVARNWQWLMTTLALPALGALWMRLRAPKAPRPAARRRASARRLETAASRPARMQ